MSKAYLLGALHDGTKRKYTYRISQKHQSFVRKIAAMIEAMGFRAWVYREGKSRELYIVEFSVSILEDFETISEQDKIDYIRGYFDAEGSVPLNGSRMYIYFCQKDKQSLLQVKEFLEHLGIICGEIHNPSKKEDPDYWRFFLSCKSYRDFATKIGSKHPVKRKILEKMI
jgi:intein-encoded DNA endonuclease-like protein